MKKLFLSLLITAIFTSCATTDYNPRYNDTPEDRSGTENPEENIEERDKPKIEEREPTPEQSASLLINGDFEELNGNNVYPWIPSRGNQFASLYYDENIKYEGDRSVYIKIDKNHKNEKADYSWNATIDEFIIESTYSLTGRIKTKNVSQTPWIEVECLDKTNRNVLGSASTKYLFDLSGSNDWKLVEVLIKIPPKTNKILIKAGISLPDNNGSEVWFDDIKFKEIKNNF